MTDILTEVWGPLGLVLIGGAVATFGTLVGSGGGFLLVPILALLRPDLSTSSLTAVSLAVVTANGASGAIAYARRRRVDFRSGIPFALAALPASVLGALLTRYVSRGVFDLLFAGLLLLLAVFVVLRHRPGGHDEDPGTRGSLRRLIDREGTRYVYRVYMPLGIAASFVIGALSSVFGIGGGIVHVPVLVGLLGVPAHVATATSQFALSLMSATGSATHLLSGHLEGLGGYVLWLALGAFLGGQIGARISGNVSAGFIVRALALGLIAAGARLGWKVFVGV